MLRIAVCDDDRRINQQIEGFLDEICPSLGIDFSCEPFQDGDTLIHYLEAGNMVDLLFLDVEMPIRNGEDTALRIRSLQFPTLIIYVSSHVDRLSSLLPTEPFRWLNKPIPTETLRKYFMDAVERIQNGTEIFSFNIKRESYKIPLKYIRYFESRNRTITLYTRTKLKNNPFQPDYTFYGKMNDVEKQINSLSRRFLRVHQSYLVNYDYIRSITKSNCTLYDGQILFISEERIKQVQEQWISLLSMRSPE